MDIEGESNWTPAKRKRTKRNKPRLFVCACCGKPNPNPGTRSAAIDRIDELGNFCTLRCAARYGVNAVLDLAGMIYGGSP